MKFIVALVSVAVLGAIILQETESRVYSTKELFEEYVRSKRTPDEAEDAAQAADWLSEALKHTDQVTNSSVQENMERITILLQNLQVPQDQQ